jgi:ABC-type polysaccharide transport system permease subunit
MSFDFIGTIDVSDFKNNILSLGETSWNENTQRQKYHGVLRDTQFIPLMWDDQTISQLFYGKKTRYYDILDFAEVKSSIELKINSKLNLNGVIFRAILARVGPNVKIPEHVDGPKSNNHCKKIHVPIVTNDMVFFTVDGEERNLKEGEIWEVDVSKLHSVHNKSSEGRIHLIVMYNEKESMIVKSLDS